MVARPDDEPTASGVGGIEAIRNAPDLDALQRHYDVDSKHEAYFAAKRDWARLHTETAATTGEIEGLPGDVIETDGRTFHVHGVTHADTEAERRFLRNHVIGFLEAGHAVYTEQGIRRMYFQDLDAVYEMDDIRWALKECQRLDIESILSDLSTSEFESLREDVRGIATRFRQAAFSLIDSGREYYGDAFADALGDVASQFLMSHGELATGEAFEAFRRTKAAAEDPEEYLPELQAYYRRTFLPQPLEREWLWYHDPELEVMTHARNERMAKYLLANTGTTETVHAVVGAAHQPGVRYYLDRHRRGEFDASDFEPV